MKPRCIAIDDDRRCRRAAGKRSGDIYVCSQHATLWRMLLIDDATCSATRTMLATEKWETAAEGQALIWKKKGA